MSNWTEECTGIDTYEKDHVVYHISSIGDGKIKAFQSKETCFFTSSRPTKGDGHAYRITFKKTVQVECYGNEEIRFTPTNENCSIEYMGKTEIIYTGNDTYDEEKKCWIKDKIIKTRKCHKNNNVRIA